MRASLSVDPNQIERSRLLTPRESSMASFRFPSSDKNQALTDRRNSTNLPALTRTTNPHFKSMTLKTTMEEELPKFNLKEIIYKSHSKTMCLTSSISHRAGRMTDRLYRLKSELDNLSVSKQNQRFIKTERNITGKWKREFEVKVNALDKFAAKKGVKLSNISTKSLKDLEAAEHNALKNSGIKLNLFDKKSIKVELESGSYLRGSIDSRNKYLPLEITYKGYDVKSKTYISFSGQPTYNKNDMVSLDTNIVLNDQALKAASKSYSIKFMLIALNSFTATIKVKFKGKRPVHIRQVLPKFKRIKYEEFYAMNIKIPKSVKAPKKLDIVMNNPKKVDLYNQNYRKLISQKKVEIYEMKRKKVLEARSLQREKLKKVYSLEEMEEAMKEKRKRDLRVFKAVVKKGLKLSRIVTWTQMVKKLSVIQAIHKKFMNKKRAKDNFEVLKSKAAFIGIMFKAKLERRLKTKLHMGDKVKTYYIGNIYANLRRKEVRRACKKILGVFFKTTGRVVVVRMRIHEFVIRNQKISSGWLQNKKTKKKAYKIFKNALEKAKMKFIDNYSIKFDKPPEGLHYIDKNIMYKLFEICFYSQTFDWIHKKHDLVTSEKLKLEQEKSPPRDKYAFHSKLSFMEQEEAKKKAQIFRLDEIVKFEKMRKSLEQRPLYRLFSQVNRNSKNKFYDQYLYPRRLNASPSLKQAVNTVTTGIAIAKMTKGLGSPNSNSSKKKGGKKSMSLLGKKKKKGRIKLRNLIEKKDPLKEKEDEDLKYAEQALMGRRMHAELSKKLEIQNLMKEFVFEVDERWFFVLIMNTIDYFKDHPKEFQSLCLN